MSDKLNYWVEIVILAKNSKQITSNEYQNVIFSVAKFVSADITFWYSLEVNCLSADIILWYTLKVICSVLIIYSLYVIKEILLLFGLVSLPMNNEAIHVIVVINMYSHCLNSFRIAS